MWGEPSSDAALLRSLSSNTVSGGGHNEICELTCCNECRSTQYGKDDYLSTVEQTAKNPVHPTVGQAAVSSCRITMDHLFYGWREQGNIPKFTFA